MRGVLLWLLALLAAGLVSAGLAGASTPSVRLAWLKPWSAWTTDLQDDLDAAEKARVPPAVITRLETCDRMTQRVPVPPADFRQLAGLDVSVCQKVNYAATLGVPLRPGFTNAVNDAYDAYDHLLDVTWRALFFNRPLPVRGGLGPESRIEPRLSRVAQSVWGLAKPVEVRCWSATDWKQTVDESNAWYGDKDSPADLDGFAEPDDRRIHLPQTICAPLARLLYGDGAVSTDALAYSIGTLTHEATHIARPDGSEAVTECHGMQKVDAGALALGLPAARAREIADYYWRTIYLHEEAAGYFTKKCRPNGPLDLTPGDGVWP
jgi:hypothetical protein